VSIDEVSELSPMSRFVAVEHGLARELTVGLASSRLIPTPTGALSASTLATDGLEAIAESGAVSFPMIHQRRSPDCINNIEIPLGRSPIVESSAVD
jgi:hypothetical protein